MRNDEKWSNASLRIISAIVNPVQITGALHIEPSSTHSKGDPVSKRNPSGPRRKENMWILDSGLDDSLPLNDHIEKLVIVMEANFSQLKSLRPQCEYDIWCSFASENGQGGFVLEANLLRRIAAMECNLVVSLYPPEARDKKDMPKGLVEG